jgi:hypothetical protein
MKQMGVNGRGTKLVGSFVRPNETIGGEGVKWKETGWDRWTGTEPFFGRLEGDGTVTKLVLGWGNGN